MNWRINNLFLTFTALFCCFLNGQHSMASHLALSDLEEDQKEKAEAPPRKLADELIEMTRTVPAERNGLIAKWNLQRQKPDATNNEMKAAYDKAVLSYLERMKAIEVELTKNSPIFPCDLKKFSSLPAIVLVPNIHDNNAADVAKSSQLSRNAFSGKIYLGIEGNAHNDRVKGIDLDQELEKRGLFGIDDPDVFAIADIITGDSATKVFSGSKDFLKARERALREFVQRPAHRRALKQIAEATTFKAFKNILSHFGNLELKSPDDLEMKALPVSDKQMEKQLKDLIEADDQTWAFLLKAMVESDFNRRYEKVSAKYRPNLRSLLGNINSADDLEASLLSLEFNLIWRNIDTARNIGGIYCKAAKDGKDLYVYFGAMHLGGLVDILTRNSSVQLPLKVETTEHHVNSIRNTKKRIYDSLFEKWKTDNR